MRRAWGSAGRPAGAPQPRAWALVGFSGAGKTTVGPYLARASGRLFVDLDGVVAARGGASVAVLLAREGEPAFRVRETEALRAVVDPAPGAVSWEDEGLVVSLGAGVLESPAAADILAARATLIWLDVPLETCLSRLEAGAGGMPRPVLEAVAREGGRAAVEELYRRRVEAYARAAMRVDGAAEPAVVARRLLLALQGAPDPR